jgi:hypothetical protein
MGGDGLIMIVPGICGCTAMALGVAIAVKLTAAAELSAFDFSAVEQVLGDWKDPFLTDIEISDTACTAQDKTDVFTAKWGGTV